MLKFLNSLIAFIIIFSSYAGEIDSFEDIPSSDHTTLSRPYGTFTVSEGTLSIQSGHGATGNKALRIQAGKANVQLKLNETLTSNAILSFRAQRWTRSGPFKFSIETIEEGTTTPKRIYTGDHIPLEYSPKIEIPLSKGTKILRFISHTGGTLERRNGGILIDDLQIDPLLEMKVESVNIEQHNTPMLIHSNHNELLSIHMNAHGEKDPVELSEIIFTFNGSTDLYDFDGLALYDVRDVKPVRIAQTFITGGKATFKLKYVLKHGKNPLILRPIFSSTVSIDNRIDAQCVSIKFNNSDISFPFTVVKDAEPLRIGIDMGPYPADSCHTFRIPGLARTRRGTLIAVWDNRYKSAADLQGDIDIGMRRSTDGGNKWSPLQPIINMGTYDFKPEDQNGVSSPCILVDNKTNTIWVAALWMNGKPGQRVSTASKPGLTPDETGQIVLVKSTDDGVTWSKPIHITQQIKKPEWNLFFQGPGKGICMKNGTLVFPAQYKDANDVSYSTIIYSQNHGITWHVGKGAKPNTTEAQVVELDNGNLMLNMRDNNGGSSSVCVTNDLGRTWKKHSSDRKGLQDPICQASLIRWHSYSNPKILLFSNPNTTSGRHHLTLKASLDDGTTWPVKHQLMYDPRPTFGYSCLTQIDEKYVGVLYEGRGQMYFMRIPIKEIIKL